MSSGNYVKSKLLQLEAFCIIVENDSNAAEACRKTGKSSQTLNNALLSLEDELKYQLFDRKGNRLTLNLQGEKYYPIAKKAINEIKIASSKQIDHPINAKAPNKTIIYIKDFCTKYFSWRFIKKIKYKLCFMVIVCTLYLCVDNYLTKINYWFDRDLYDNASPRLKNLIKDGSYTISETISCSFDVTQINLDMYEMIKKQNNIYKDLSVAIFIISDSPLISMRLTGNENIDNVFASKNFTICNTEKFYRAIKNHFYDAIYLFAINKNFKIYNLYYNNIDSCLNCNYFIENTKKYPNNLFGEKINKLTKSDARGWIIRRGDYYYLLSMSNIISAEEMKNNNLYGKQERHIFWKKMTETELMSYKNCIYWNIIEKYGIKV